MDILAYIILFSGMLLGLLMIPFGLPGAWLSFFSIVVYAWLTGFDAAVGVRMLIVFGVLTLIAETADNWLTALGAKRYGASGKSMWLALLGGLAGAILLGAPLALALGFLGPVAGGFLGAFAAVSAYEYYLRQDVGQALRAGWGAFVGRMAGIMLKLVIAIGIVIAVAIRIAL